MHTLMHAGICLTHTHTGIRRASGSPYTLVIFCDYSYKIFVVTFQLILDKFLQAMDESRLPYVSTQWMLGKKYIFFR